MELGNYVIKFPNGNGSGHLDQDQEFCILKNGAGSRKVRFHDYHEIYKIEGLYEHLFYEVLKCNSPRTVCQNILRVTESMNMDPAELNVLDLGAGNGMVGEELMKAGAGKVIGVDIIEEAREAQLRDRPEVYEDYIVEDFTRLDEEVRGSLAGEGLNCMTTVAALGFGDIPPLAFAEGFNLIEEEGIIAFNIRDKFIESPEESNFSELISTISEENILAVKVKEKYCHRLDIEGNPLNYYVIAGVKNEDIPMEIIEAVS